MHRLTRREFSIALGSTVVGSALGCRTTTEPGDLDAFILEQLERDRAPGFSAAVVAGSSLVWSAGYGLADVHRETVMTPDTIQNIGSISKTITATAVMQLFETGQFGLDDDVSEYLPFQVRNPRYPDAPITFRQLLAHRSSIKDGPAYGESYACGDPAGGAFVGLAASLVFFTPSLSRMESSSPMSDPFYIKGLVGAAE